MYNRNQMLRLVLIVLAILLTAIPSVQAQDQTVNGNLTVNGNAVLLKSARIDGPVGIGVNPSSANLRIFEPGSGVGIFVGDRAPFGQALFETDLRSPATHAFFAENGNPVFFVAGGGNGFFKGKLDVGGVASIKSDINIDGNANILGEALVGGNFTMGNAVTGSTALVQIYGERPFHAFASTRFTILANGNVGVGTSTPTQQLHVAGNAQIDQILLVGQKVSSVPGLAIGQGGNNPKLQVGGNVAIMGNETLTGNQTLIGNQTLNGNQRLNGSQTFGVQRRQMINLFDTTYGIGVQESAFYLRTDNEFFWYKGGRHSDTFADPGERGTQLMRLGNTGDLIVSHSVVTPVLEITGGNDLAEPFKMSRQDIPKGAVVIIDEENAGHLKLSEGAYDRRVAGIVSGANGINPGISLSQQSPLEGGQNVALSGRVYVLADASTSPIKPGDLLTTSDTPGYAMKVTDYNKAQGAVIGKAMNALKEGKGMVLVLVSLQ
jgi:hypothetical protein